LSNRSIIYNNNQNNNNIYNVYSCSKFGVGKMKKNVLFGKEA